MQPYIYKITDLRNNKYYIGQHNGKDKKYFTSSTIIQRILNKYGLGAKEFLIKDIVTMGDFNKVLLDELEKHYIRLYNTKYPYGYNLTDGGDTVNQTPEVIEKISKTWFKKGHVSFVKGTKGFMKVNSGSFKNGVRYSIATEFKKGNKLNVGKKYDTSGTVDHGNSVKVAQYTKDGEFIRNWDSITKAGRSLGKTNFFPICQVAKLKKKYKTAYGFIWKYI